MVSYNGLMVEKALVHSNVLVEFLKLAGSFKPYITVWTSCLTSNTDTFVVIDGL